jgi:hypothetical protein
LAARITFRELPDHFAALLKFVLAVEGEAGLQFSVRFNLHEATPRLASGAAPRIDEPVRLVDCLLAIRYPVPAVPSAFQAVELVSYGQELVSRTGEKGLFVGAPYRIQGEVYIYTPIQCDIRAIVDVSVIFRSYARIQNDIIISQLRTRRDYAVQLREQAWAFAKIVVAFVREIERNGKLVNPRVA